MNSSNEEWEEWPTIIYQSIIYHWSIGAFFYGNYVVTVLSSVEHAVTEACDLKKKSCPQHDRFPHKIIDRGA